MQSWRCRQAFYLERSGSVKGFLDEVQVILSACPLHCTAHCSMRPTHTLIGVLLWSNYTIVEKDIHVLAGVVEDALHSRAQEIGKIK